MINDIVKEKRKRSFDHIVITPSIIRDIAKLVANQAGSDEKVKVIFTLDAKNISFESGSPIIFDKEQGKMEKMFIHTKYKYI